MSERYSLVDNSNENEFSKNVKFNSDERLIILQPGQTLKCRLLRFKDALSTRKDPWITKFIHAVYVKESKDSFTTKFTSCPSTQSFNILNPKNRCLICPLIDETYSKIKNAETENKKDSLYKVVKTLKRKFKMFIPVYVISNNGVLVNKTQILMLQNMDYLFRINKFFREINAESPELVNMYFNHLGDIDSFNFNIAVDQKNVFDIKFGFEPAETPLIKDFNLPDVQKAFLEQHITPLNFDKDFYENSFDDDKHLEFFEMFASPLFQKIGVLNHKTEVPEQLNQEIIPDTPTKQITPEIFVEKNPVVVSPTDEIIASVENTVAVPENTSTPKVLEEPVKQKETNILTETKQQETPTSNKLDQQQQDILDIYQQIEAINNAK
jgi:hypothetical protein